MVSLRASAGGRGIAAAFGCALVAGCLAAGPVLAQDQAAATQDVITARKTLMDFMCDRMTEIETMVGSGKIDLAIVHQYADAMSPMLLAFPHLFPPSSNLWRKNPNPDPVTDTFASPDVWTGFADFYQQAQESAKLARELARTGSSEDARDRARELRIACDACHALYLEEP